LFLELSKGNYEFPTRPKSKVGIEGRITLKPVSNTGEGLLLKIRSCIGQVKMIMACGWTTPKTTPPITLELKVRVKFLDVSV
jgi:hypothetical protein